MATASPADSDRDPFADRRVHPRVDVALPAFLQADGERHSVQLHDLSNGGAKLHCAMPLTVGSTVMLDCGTLGRSAVVRWQNGDLVGLSFESELDARDVADLAARSKALMARMNPGG